MQEMNKFLIGALIAFGALYFIGNSGGVIRLSGGSGVSKSSGAGIKGYANSSRGAVKGVGSAAGKILN